MIRHIVAPDVARYPRPSAISELALLTGYSAAPPPIRVQRVVEAQPCVCGGVIDPGVDDEIPAAVALHNASRQHLAWRERMGIE